MLLGSTIDPRLMVQDYSGIAKAGEIQGQMYAQMGKDIGGAIQGGAQAYQQGKQMQGQVDAASKGYASLAKAFPEQAEFFNSQAQGLNDPSTSLIQKMGYLSSGQQMFGNMYQIQSAIRDQRMLEYKLGGGSSGYGKSTNPLAVR